MPQNSQFRKWSITFPLNAVSLRRPCALRARSTPRPCCKPSSWPSKSATSLGTLHRSTTCDYKPTIFFGDLFVWNLFSGGFRQHGHPGRQGCTHKLYLDHNVWLSAVMIIWFFNLPFCICFVLVIVEWSVHRTFSAGIKNSIPLNERQICISPQSSFEPSA